MAKNHELIYKEKKNIFKQIWKQKTALEIFPYREIKQNTVVLMNIKIYKFEVVCFDGNNFNDYYLYKS